ncbi:MAG: hypothetical protein E7Z89_07185 [Cyanobacteria bacterium SIG28]|nr:hypothetical protein [Cyanobacteria bacterium SIG28]
MDKKIEIVSLGPNCLPRTVLTRGGIKPSKAEGELSCPFDLVAHKLPNIIHYLETDFSDYFEDFYFDVRKRNFLDFRKKGFWKKKDGTVFNHDKDCKINDKDKLIQRFKNRIANFYNITSGNLPVLFILNLQTNPECVPNLYEILRKFCKSTKFKIFVIDFNDLLENCDNDNIYVLKLPLPIENYHDGFNGWNNKKFRESELGIYVEKCICDEVKRVIKTMV